MSKPTPTTGKTPSGFFADTLGPRVLEQANLGKNAAAPSDTRQEGFKRQPTAAAPSAPKASSAPPRAAPPPPPEPPKKKKGWF